MKRIFLFIGFFLWLFLITVIHIGISRSGRVITQLQNDVSIKEARNQYLKLEIARLSGRKKWFYLPKMNWDWYKLNRIILFY